MTNPDVEGGCSSRYVPDIVQLKFTKQGLATFGHTGSQAVWLEFQTSALQTLLARFPHQSLHRFPVLRDKKNTQSVNPYSESKYTSSHSFPLCFLALKRRFKFTEEIYIQVSILLLYISLLLKERRIKFTKGNIQVCILLLYDYLL